MLNMLNNEISISQKTKPSAEPEDHSIKFNQSEMTINSGYEQYKGIKDDIHSINEQFQVLGLPQVNIEDVSYNNQKQDCQARNINNNYNDILSKGSAGSTQSIISSRNKYCFNNNITNGK